MNMTFYLISLAITFVIFGLHINFAVAYKKEYEKNEDTFLRRHNKAKYEHNTKKLSIIFGILTIVCIILFSICNIYVLIFKSLGTISFVISGLYIILLISISICVINIIMIDTNIKIIIYFKPILKGINIILFIICIFVCIFYTWAIIVLTISGNKMPINDIEQKCKEYSYSIEIIQIEEIPYTNMSGGRWYIKSTPSIAYYYNIVTENGNTTTKVLDAYQYYVELDEDDKYANNPHIEVYEITKKYTNIYGKEKEEFMTYEYTICVPDNSIYYED